MYFLNELTDPQNRSGKVQNIESPFHCGTNSPPSDLKKNVDHTPDWEVEDFAIISIGMLLGFSRNRVP